MKPYINCFTGAIAHTLDNPNIQESDLMLLGHGYLLRSGSDEYGLPEINFPVQACGERALDALGIKFSRHFLNKNFDFTELKTLCSQYSQYLFYSCANCHGYSNLSDSFVQMMLDALFEF